MGIKILLVYGLVGISCIAARKYTFFSLCVLITLVGLMENTDFIPRSVFGIPGFNAWNILFLTTTYFWFFLRNKSTQLPRSTFAWLIAYCACVFISSLRMAIEPTHYIDLTFSSALFDYFINPLKFVLPAVMLYGLCNTRNEAKIALVAICISYFILAIQIIKYMGISDFSGSNLNRRGVIVISRDTGYHRVDASMMLAGASWAIFSLKEIFKHKAYQIVIISSAAITVLAQALTGGRAGYLAFVATGLAMCVIRWKKLLLLAPIGLLLFLQLMPGITERMFSGFNDSGGVIVQQNDSDAITSGRVKIWPHVIAEIKQNPIIGHGREGMKRSGLTEFSTYEIMETWPQPHNAYLELLLDNGIVGAILILPIYFISLHKGYLNLLHRSDGLIISAGAICTALMIALLVASIGSQTFYPRQGMIGLFCAMAVTLKVYYYPELFSEKTTSPYTETSKNS